MKENTVKIYARDLKEGDFKQGLLDELNEIKKILEDNDRSS